MNHNDGNRARVYDDAQVLIVGGGPVGIALAIDLGQRGIEVVVLETHHQPQFVPKGQNLTQRTMEHFQSWGAEEHLRACQPIPPGLGSGGLTAYGTLLGGQHHHWLQRNLVNSYYTAENARLPQYETENVLRRRLAEIPTARLLTGWHVQNVERRDFGVEVVAACEETAVTRSFSAPFLVGCDGSRSIVRQSADIPVSQQDHDKLMVLMVFRSREFDRLLERFPGKSYFNVLHPELGGYWQFFGRVDTDHNFFFHAPVPERTGLDVAEMASLLHRAAGAEFQADITYSGFWDLRFAIADTYRAGSIFIAGDAAHSHPPYGGYGINTGLEDARNLGWKLAAKLQGWGGEALLDSYSAERQTVFASTATDFIAKSIAADRNFLAGNAITCGGEAFDQALAERAQAACDDVFAYAPQYSASPVVFGKTGGATSARGWHGWPAQPGHHLSPAPMEEGGGTVCNRLGAGFALVTSSVDCGSRFSMAAEALHIPLSTVVGSAPLLEADHVLVRPDGFVAWTASDETDPVDPAAILERACGLTG